MKKMIKTRKALLVTMLFCTHISTPMNPTIDTASNQKASNILLEQAIQADDSHNYELARTLYTQLAQENHPLAQCNLASMLQNGEGGPQDAPAARNLYRLAAQQGEIDAYTLLGSMWEFGQGGKQNIQYALSLYEYAALRNQPDALLALSRIINSLRATNNQPALAQLRAIYHRLIGAGIHDTTLVCYLGIMNYAREGGEQNHIQARKLFTYAAHNHNTEAQTNLAVMLYHGQGGPRDVNLARRLLTHTAGQGDAQAQHNLNILITELFNNAQHAMQSNRQYDYYPQPTTLSRPTRPH